MEGLCPNSPTGEAEVVSPPGYCLGQGGLILPTNLDVKTGTLVADVLRSKHPNRTSPPLEAFCPYVSSPALIDLDITSDIIDWVAKTMKGTAGP